MKTVPLLLVIMASVIPAHTAPITFQFTGVVIQVPIDDLYGDIAPATLIQGAYIFNSATPDSIPADPSTASYTSSGPPFAMNAGIAGHNFTVLDFVNIGIFNSFVDQYTVFATNPGGNLTLELFFQDNTGGAFAGDSLPLIPPALADFAIRDFHLHQIGAGGETQVDGQITGLACVSGCVAADVPEPSLVLPICIGSLAILTFSRPKPYLKANHRISQCQSIARR